MAVKNAPEAATETPGELAARLRVITAAVPGLRKAGVLELEIPGLILKLDPPLLEPTKPSVGDPDGDFLDPSKFRGDRPDRDPADPGDDDGDDDDGGEPRPHRRGRRIA